MKLIAVSMEMNEGERSQKIDSLSQKWFGFLRQCGVLPVLIPNHLPTAKKMIEQMSVEGILLTGGSDLHELGGNALERDGVEQYLLNYAIRQSIPLMGVGRGMQLIQLHFGVKLRPVMGHNDFNHPLQLVNDTGIGFGEIEVNSHHQFAARDTVTELEDWARAADFHVEAIRHVKKPLCGIMWHPELYPKPRLTDVELFKSVFKVKTKEPEAF